MKKLSFILVAALAVGYTGCKKSDFAEAYPDPSKISVTTVEKQFAGFLNSDKNYVVPDYWNYFVVLRTTINHYTQAVGYANGSSQWVPGASGIDSRWGTYYSSLAQYRELEKIYNTLSETDKKDRRIYMIAATIYLYDRTQQVVDLHGDIPFSEAGKLSANGGDYAISLPKYDNQDAIYTKMLDGLKAFSEELNTISVLPAIAKAFGYQDLINKGNMTFWKKYCNSLRLRMLTRVSSATAFSARATSEISAILANPTAYPVVAANAENVQINIYSQTDPGINARGFRSGLEDWSGNVAGKVMIDHMNTNADPRLRVMYEPYMGRPGKPYIGLDPMMSSTEQTKLLNDTVLAIYNRSTLSRNQFFPGVIVNAAEVSFLTAEAYLKAGNAAAAKTAYNDGISKSVYFYYSLRALSNDNTAGAVTPTSDAEIAAYIAKPAINWDMATTAADQLKLIANQKWIHYSVVQPTENWAELRRLDLPVLSYEVDNSNTQKLPPYRWFYAGSEKIYNTVNYNAVAAKDNLSTKIFWDTK